MLRAVRINPPPLPSSPLAIKTDTANISSTTTLTPSSILRLPSRIYSSRRSTISLKSNAFTDTTTATPSSSQQPSISSSEGDFTSSVGSPPLMILSHRHVTALTFAACAAAFSATWLFCAAIPTLLAFKRAAESLEKLLDVTREELPGTMAAVRLSGMEISDLTMELSDLGQEITHGVRKSTHAVRAAEEKLRGFANMTSKVPMQVPVNARTTATEPAVAKTARSLREGIIKGRGVLQMLFAVMSFSRSVGTYLSNRSKRRAISK